LICFIALLLTGASLSQFFFVFFYVANILIGVIQEIRAKKCIDRLSIVVNKATKVVRDGKTIEITCGWHKTDITHTIGGIQIVPIEEGGWTYWLKCPYIQY
jgi:hypothetical protein